VSDYDLLALDTISGIFQVVKYSNFQYIVETSCSDIIRIVE
jgi:hypothetical protein